MAQRVISAFSGFDITVYFARKSAGWRLRSIFVDVNIVLPVVFEVV